MSRFTTPFNQSLRDIYQPDWPQSCPGTDPYDKCEPLLPVPYHVLGSGFVDRRHYLQRAHALDDCDRRPQVPAAFSVSPGFPAESEPLPLPSCTLQQLPWQQGSDASRR